jgi:hypothetical protein
MLVLDLTLHKNHELGKTLVENLVDSLYDFSWVPSMKHVVEVEYTGSKPTTYVNATDKDRTKSSRTFVLISQEMQLSTPPIQPF